MTIAVEKPIICPVLVGRDHHVAALRHLLNQTSSGQGQMLLLCGEAGIGKSRLVAELTTSATAQGFHVLEGKCFPTDLTCPYAPLLDLLYACFAPLSPTEIASLVGPFARVLAPLLPDQVVMLCDLTSLPPLPSLDPDLEKRRLFAALADFLTQQAMHRPLLLIVEDLHWSDESSLEFLHYLARRTWQHRLLLLLTYRSDEVSPGLLHLLTSLDRERLAREYQLAHLSRAEVEAMLQAIFAGQPVVGGELLEMLYALTDGNPFFLEEVLKSMLTSGRIALTESGWVHLVPAQERRFAIPRSVQDAVQQRTQSLSPKGRQLLILAAVAGRRFDVAVLQRLLICKASQMTPLLKEVVAAQLVVEESADQFSFRHALTRQAIYAGLLAGERRALHRRVARTIEQLFVSPAALDAHMTDLAYHCFQGEDWEKAREYGQRAGEKALALWAPRTAVEHLSRAVEAASHLSASAPATLYRARGQAYELLGEFERARADYEQAFALAQETQERFLEWQGLLDLGFLWASRDYIQAGQWFRQALDLAQVLADPRLHARSLNRLANCLVNTGRIEEGMHMHQQALLLFEAQQDILGKAETFDLLGTANGIFGDTVTAVQHYGQAIALFRAGGDTRSLISTLSMRAAYSSLTLAETSLSPLRTRDDCVNELVEALHLARQSDSQAALAFAEEVMGIVLSGFGEFGAALAHLHESSKIATGIGHQQWIAGGHCLLGNAYILVLEPTLARKALETALALAHELGSAWWTALSTAFLARAYLLKRELGQAEAVLAARLPRDQRPRDLGERLIHLAWGELALAQDQPERALQIAQELLDTVPGGVVHLTRQPIPWLLTLQGEALLSLSRPDEAIGMLEEARRGTIERREHSRLWYVHGLLARAYHLAKQEEQARREGIAARRVIADLSATIDEPALSEQFTHAALATFWPGEKSLASRLLAADRYGGLTQREREVAVLIARGKSNREIADTLVVTKRTIETHINNILYKLNLTSRAQIVVWTVESGLVTQ
jgi:predicted ATPase/DNA-binding CsgD family transcriptional regulator